MKKDLEIFIPDANNSTSIKSPKHTVIDIFGSKIIQRQIIPPDNITGKALTSVFALVGSFAKYDATKIT